MRKLLRQAAASALFLSVFAPLHANAADRIIIVYPEGWLGAAQALATHRSAGAGYCYPSMTSLLASTLEIDALYNGDNVLNSTELRSYLCSLSLVETDNVILLGDDSMIPKSTFDPPGLSIYDWDDGFVDCNLDNIADAGIGRVPARNPAEISTLVAKLVSHDTESWALSDGSSSWLYLCYDHGNVGIDEERIHDSADIIYEEELPGHYRFLPCGKSSLKFSTDYASPGAPPDGVLHDAVATAVNYDVGVVWSSGTASSRNNFSHFLEAPGIASQALDWSKWWNEGSYPVAFGMSCQIGRSTSEDDLDVLRHLLLSNAKGFVGAVASTEGVDSPTVAVGTRLLMRRILEQPICGEYVSLGRMLNEWKVEMLTLGGVDATTVLSFRILGDPSMRIYARGQFVDEVSLGVSTPYPYQDHFVRLTVFDFTDETHPSPLDRSLYNYDWTTDNGEFSHAGGYHKFARTTEPTIQLVCPSGDCAGGTIASVTVRPFETAFPCNWGEAQTTIEFRSVPTDGCPIVEVKTGGQWVKKNSILSDRVYGAPSVTEDYIHVDPPTALSPMFEIRITESDPINYTMIDEIEVIYADHPASTEFLPSQDGAFYQFDGMTSPDSVWLAIGGDLTPELSAADDSMLVTVAAGDTIFAVFGDSFGPTEAAIPGMRVRTKLALTEADIDNNGPWGIRMLPEYGVGTMEPIRPRRDWYPTFVDSPIVVRGDAIADTVAWSVGEVHQLDQIFLLENAVPSPSIAVKPVLTATHSDSGNVLTAVASEDAVFARVDHGSDIEFSFQYPFVPSGTKREIIVHIKGTYEHISAPFVSDGEIARLLPWGFTEISPNPSNGRTKISFKAEGQGESCRLRVYDVGGRQVRMLLNDTANGPSLVTTTWNGRNDNGRSLATGVYFLRLEEGDRTESKKVVLLR